MLYVTGDLNLGLYRFQRPATLGQAISGTGTSCQRDCWATGSVENDCPGWR